MRNGNTSRSLDDDDSQTASSGDGGNTMESEHDEMAGDHSTSMESKRSSQSDKIAGKETAQMNRWKIMVYIALFIASMGVGTFTFFYMRDQEVKSFQNEFDGLSNLIFQLTDKRALIKYAAVTQVATFLEADIRLRLISWPNYTIQHLDATAYNGLVTANNELAFVAPVVDPSSVLGWNEYVSQDEWLQIDLADSNVSSDPGRVPPLHGDKQSINSTIHVPLWQIVPPPINSSILNFDLFSLDWFKPIVTNMMLKNKVVQSPIVDFDFVLTQLVAKARLKRYSLEEPRSLLLHPFFGDFHDHGTAANEIQVAKGFVGVVVPWASYFTELLPANKKGIIVDVSSTCGSLFTYVINGYEARYLRDSEKPKDKYRSLSRVYQLASRSPTFDEYVGSIGNDTNYDCRYSLRVYPSQEFHDGFVTNKPLLYAFLVVVVFCMTAAVFLVYDLTVQRRQRKIMATAQKTSAIVSSLFPKNIQKRIIEDVHAAVAHEETQKGSRLFGAKHQMKEFLGGGGGSSMLSGKPLADLFPAASIMFADLVGFTAWSSTREPSDVFTLLETIYHEFDMLANRRRIFKVETVGDCYVAASGLPDPRKDHAVAIARFAHDCVKILGHLMTKLEVSLGPDTTDLGVRVGIHSGPVTAGVLRGEKARFQLFGDTVNTTARIETTGAKNKIHVSQATADLLSQAGKSHWLIARGEKVQAKGKGEMTTFWLDIRKGLESSSSHGSSESNGSSNLEDEKLVTNATLDDCLAGKKSMIATMELDEKKTRLVNWNAEVLNRLLKCIVARREALGFKLDEEEIVASLERSQPMGSSVLDEVQDVILLPTFDPQVAMRQRDPGSIELEEEVVLQLHAYIRAIAQLYQNNHFHNFEHASHVTMSVTKLLGRIIAPELEDDVAISSEKTLHDHTYGITSDPLTQFACVFAALIHDTDHQGVPNSQLIKEKVPLAGAYQNKSVAEQNSVDIAWNLLLDDSYSALRRTIYATGSEYRRFRQLVVNSVMATDIMDKDLGAARKDRWNRAFAQKDGKTEGPRDWCEVHVHRKATIVIEHLIQASDVAHTMQHWHIYRKWNERLFLEMYKAYKDGRSDVDPSEKWYEGEMGFFDFYIIPLAKKLKDCGVFGVSSDEYLHYAENNRQEWESKGKDIVEKMMEAAQISQELRPSDQLVKNT